MRGGFIIGGIILMVIGAPLVFFCLGIPLVIIGVVLLIYGFVATDPALKVIQQQQAVLIQQTAMHPQPPPPPQSSRPPPCRNCSSGLTFVETYGRWYCARCNQYV